MSFRKNNYQQMSLADSFMGLTSRERKALENSWAKTFGDEIFPAIDETPFQVLYSGHASRPNTPVNVCVGALIIKELFGLSDDEVVENVLLDPRFQYALHTTSCVEQPISGKTLSRFRRRCYNYETTYGIDLYHNCITALSGKIAKMMGISSRIRRMDSMMIAANIKKLSRTELLYTCVAKLAIHLHKHGKDDILEDLEHYYAADDFNKMFYYSDSSHTDEQVKEILGDADKLLDRCGNAYDDVTEYQLLVRCLSEQTVVENGVRRLWTKEDGGSLSGVMQSPSDPDATFRTKAGKGHYGYVANVDESVGENGSVITDYQYECNNYSDVQFLKDSLERTAVQDEEATLITDGAYSSRDNRRLAEEKNINLVTTGINGTQVEDILADFEFSDDGTKVLRCPAGHEPKSCSYREQKGYGHCRCSFLITQCAECPHCKECKANLRKHVAIVTVSANAKETVELRCSHSGERFKNLARIRNGVETIPSILRKRYQVDKMPVRGLIRSKFFFGCKVAALNFRKLYTFRHQRGHYAQNPILAG